ncbi:MAG: hypothetical protein ACM3JH_13610 [Acidithiobacillales bacterium]
MSARERLAEAAREGRAGDLVAAVSADRRALRHLVALTYRPEAEIRAAAARGIGLAGRHHPKLVQEIARRLIWAMNDESGTHAVTAPEVLHAIAEEAPELLLPLVPSLLGLTADPGLREALVEVVRLVARHDPKATVSGMARAITSCEKKGRS